VGALRMGFSTKQCMVAVLLACFAATVSDALQDPLPTNRIQTRELVLVDESGRPAATLSSSNGTTVLRFVEKGKPVIEVGASSQPPFRFVRFLGEDGTVLSALNSVGRSGEASLYMGDQRSQSRVILGALASDMVGGQHQQKEGTDEWGLVLRDPRSRRSIVSAIVRSLPESPAEPGIRIVRPDGSVWRATTSPR
jgi:hypothetical protein